MTSVELFAACLSLGGVVAGGIYTYALNRSASQIKDTDGDGLSEASAKEVLHRQQESERKVEEAVGRADLAASSAEAAAARAEAASQALEPVRVRRTATNIRFSAGSAMAYTPGARTKLMHPFSGKVFSDIPGADFTVEAAYGPLTERGTEGSPPEQSSTASYEYSSTRQ